MLFDTHTHYDDEKYNEDRYEVIKKAYRSGVTLMLNASSNRESLKDCMSLAEKFPFMYAAVGIHPHSAGDMNEETFSMVAGYASNPKVVAIGEIGLDYYYDFSPRDLQRYWFIRQLNLAGELELPVIIHNRDAHEDTMKIVKNEAANKVTGVFHCYSGSVEMAKELMKLDFYISVGGAITFKNAKRIVEVVKSIPMDKLLIETDCPYLTPEPHRGKRNDSGYVRLVAEKIAEIRGITFEEVAEITMRNAKTLFRIS